MKNKESCLIKKRDYYSIFFSKLIRKRCFIISCIILTIIFLASLFVTLTVDKSEYMNIDFTKSFIPPCKEYLFGTNEFGQNFFFQIFVGSFNTIKLCFLASIINLLLGTLLGIIWGHNTKIDNLMIFIRNIFNSIPLPFFYIVVISAIGSGFWPMIFVITFLGWANLACLIRNNLIIIRYKDYNVFSHINNTPSYKIAIHNYLPHLLPIIFSTFAVSFLEAASVEVTLSYLGFHTGENNISLGYLLHNALTSNNWFDYPYLFLMPLLVIFIINIAFYYIGKTISDVSMKEDESCLK